MKIPMREPVGRNLPYDEKNLNARQGDRMYRDGKVFCLENNTQTRTPVVGLNFYPREMKPPKYIRHKNVRAILIDGKGYWEILDA
jgi:hypothetical protein